MMRSIFDLCVPRDEVLKGELREDIFAARLRDVIDGHADPIYQDASAFYDNTYPTSGLKTLIIDALGRLVGSAAGKNAVLRLETSFGGGKTHNLIALYHAARGAMPSQMAKDMFGEHIQLPKPGDIRIAGVVGSDLDPTVGIQHPADGIRTLTLWGELAYQLGGKNGYELVLESEETKAAVGTGLLETLIGDKPTLILIDEIARHLRAASAIPTRTGQSNLAEQTVAFLMSLLEFAAGKERCVVVLTLASDSDAFGKESQLLREALAEAKQVSARSERVLTPTDEREIPAIVAHRLFRSVDCTGAEPVFQGYLSTYTHLIGQNVDLPQRSSRAEYLDEFRAAYPFHPELLNTLNRKVATIPNFNQTRGALRLLAWTVRELWEKHPQDTWLIHPYHVDLAQPQIADDLTARLDRPAFRQVIQSDITSVVLGSPAHAQDIDAGLTASGKPPYAGRVAKTIFLNSLTQGIADGIEPAEILLSVITPDPAGGGDDPAVVQHNLERLYAAAWYLEYDGRRYRFKTEPSINKIIADEAQMVSIPRAKTEIEARIRNIWKKGFLQPVYFPATPADLDDDAGIPKLAIIHFDAAKVSSSGGNPPDLVSRIYERTGTSEGFRKYQNNVLFLAADMDGVDNMVQVTRRYLGVGRITGDPERMRGFNEEQKKKLRAALDAAELDVRVAITKAYRYLYHPSAEASQANSRLARETLPAQDQGDVSQDQTNALIRFLRAVKRVQTADDDELSAFYVKSRAWDEHQTDMSTEDLRRAFARKISLRILLDIGQLRKTILNGVRTGVWLYYDAREEFAYDQDSPPPAWEISEDTRLYTPAEAKRLELHIKGKWKPGPGGGGGSGPGGGGDVVRCPVCGLPIDQCICGTDGGGDKPTRLIGSGAVAQAFQQIADTGHEYEFTHFSRLIITIDGLGRSVANDLRGMGLAVPQFGKGDVALDLDLSATFGQAKESFSTRFTGGWDRYKRLKPVSDAFAVDADDLRATLRVTIQYDEKGLGLESQEFATLRDVLVTLQIGKIDLIAIPIQDATK
jgi:hypothetical protein